jgi:non-canonical (house-cleaning) NTP pyrophosphatase
MSSQDSIKFTYIKNNNYSVHHVDGAYGGITPKGDITLNFFSERFPIPNTVTHELIDGKTLGKEIDKVSKEGIIREIECGIIINLDTARSINKWLIDKINEIENIIKQGE